MKKTICLFMLCLIFLSGCSGFVENSNPTTIHPTTIHPTTTHNGVHIFRPMGELKTPEEIEDFAKSELAPSGFVKPEDLSAFGTSTSPIYFYPEAYGNTYVYDKYLMIFRDANGVYSYIQVDHSGYPGYETRYIETNFTRTKLSKSQEMVNMLRLETRDTGWITCGKIKYFYLHGKLETIIFNVGDIEFSLKYISEIEDYPEDGANTFLKKLLSTNERESSAAVDEFSLVILCRGIEKWLIPTGIGVGVVALGVTGFVVWKKKKRKATNTTESPEPQPVDTPEQA